MKLMCLFKKIADTTVEQTDIIFGINRDGIFCEIAHYFNLISETDAPVGIIGNTLASFSTHTSRNRVDQKQSSS